MDISLESTEILNSAFWFGFVCFGLVLFVLVWFSLALFGLVWFGSDLEWSW
jgi:hypothetical protein